ncbi:hypothetical protein EUGRSUZ_I02382 [Eucalyptus grandis]|uniref:Uncharacterized protein n=2 Tax=Eucalyptus grandis TaxID=71139 RepID=A0ACC3JIE1_EUCGR|nr:hypothetical protein EUGRSUZ_I02382 [Eucalyptus grandis]
MPTDNLTVHASDKGPTVKLPLESAHFKMEAFKKFTIKPDRLECSLKIYSNMEIYSPTKYPAQKIYEINKSSLVGQRYRERA